jgi:hypothetical protein
LLNQGARKRCGGEAASEPTLKIAPRSAIR